MECVLPYLTDSERFNYIQNELKTTRVLVDDVKAVWTEADRRKAVYTSGLQGCSGFLLMFEGQVDPSLRGALIGHFSPLIMNWNKFLIWGESLTEIAEVGVSAEGIIAHNGEADPDSPTGYSISPDDSWRVDRIKEFIWDCFGRRIPLISAGYPAAQGKIRLSEAEFTERGTMIAEFPPLNAPASVRIGGTPINLREVISNQNMGRFLL